MQYLHLADLHNWELQAIKPSVRLKKKQLSQEPRAGLTNLQIFIMGNFKGSCEEHSFTCTHSATEHVIGIFGHAEHEWG